MRVMTNLTSPRIATSEYDSNNSVIFNATDINLKDFMKNPKHEE